MREVQLEISDEVEGRLNDLQVRIGAQDYSEVIRRALGFYNTLLTTKENGGRVALITKTGKSSDLVIE